jgi:hypothetical protein
MVRRVFFSFHFDRNHWRANQVRNSWLTQDNRESAGYIDAADWEDLKRQGEDAIKRWIRSQMENTSVVAVLIGTRTAERDWVEFEIKEALKEGKGIVGVRVHNLEDQNGNTDSRGDDPLDDVYIVDGELLRLSKAFNTYSWVLQNGYDNFGDWVEEAAEIAGR